MHGIEFLRVEVRTKGLWEIPPREISLRKFSAKEFFKLGDFVKLVDLVNGHSGQVTL